MLWFHPDADKKRVFTDEMKARQFAAKEEIAQWNPLLEHRLVCVITELVPL